MAIMAAMKKVLSPISDTMMTEKEAMNAWKKPTLTHSTTPFVSSVSCTAEGSIRHFTSHTCTYGDS